MFWMRNKENSFSIGKLEKGGLFGPHIRTMSYIGSYPPRSGGLTKYNICAICNLQFAQISFFCTFYSSVSSFFSPVLK